MTQRTVPCRLCGYHAPAAACPHCQHVVRDASLTTAPGRSGRIRDGLAAVPRGIALIATTRGTKRWLVPPFLLTSVVYCAALIYAWTWISRGIDAARAGSIDELGLREGWFRDVLFWIVERDAVAWLAKGGGFLLLLVVAAFVALWTFSIVYALIASPFLDVVHARIEARWFGRDPADAASGSVPMSGTRRTRILLACAAASLLGLAAWWWEWTAGAAWWLCAVPGSLALAAALAGDFRAWLASEIRSQLRALLPGIKASILTTVVLVACIWVKFIPVAGYFVFAGLAGFTSAVGLLDVAFSRRRFDLRQRLSFVAEHAPAILAFGVAESLVFLVPIVGPLIGVPTASAGGLWLVCRLDKQSLRPKDSRAHGPPTIPSATAPRL